MSDGYNFGWVDEPYDANAVAAKRLRQSVTHNKLLQRPGLPLANLMTGAASAVASPFVGAYENRNKLQSPVEMFAAPAAAMGTAYNKLYRESGDDRFKTFPERIARSGIGAVQDAASDQFATVRPDPVTGMVSDEAMSKADAKAFQGVQDLSNAVVGGGLIVGKPDLKSAGRTLGSGIVPKEVEKSLGNVKPSKDLEEWYPNHEKIEDTILPVSGLASRAIIDAEGIRRTDKIVAKMQSDKGYWERPLVDEKGNVLEGQHRIDAALSLGLEEVPVTVIRPKDTTQTAKPAPVFYSGVEHALENTSLATGTADQWLGTLKNAKGIKPEEMQWLGVEEFLAEKKAAGQKVTRAELQDHVRQNKIEVKEIKKQGETTNEYMAWNQAYDKALETTPRRRREGDDTYLERVGERARELQDEILATGSGGVKYSDYQLPGGRDYGELLLTMSRPGDRISWSGADGARLRWLEDQKTKRSLNGDEIKELQQLSKDADLRDKRPDDYSSSHWDEPNVLAHVRYNTRDIDGKKTLHIEEIQSDWHQAGKKKGYNTPRDPSKWVAEVLEPAGTNARTEPLWLIKDETGTVLGNVMASSAEEAIKKTMKVPGRLKSDSVPDAPFKKSWPELSFKRMLRHAAENGYDAISWTPGEAQAARYDLSKHIDQLKWYRDGDGYRISGSKDGNIAIQQTGLTPEKLEATVGKDIAKQIVENQEQHGVIKEGGLKVGGEGMMRFYDDQLVAIASKYAKAHGGKVEQKPLAGDIEIIDVGQIQDARTGGTRNGYQVDSPNDPNLPPRVFFTRKEAEDYVRALQPAVHYMELPSTLRDTALRKGFPLFSHGVMLTPVEGNPFEPKKEPKP